MQHKLTLLLNKKPTQSSPMTLHKLHKIISKTHWSRSWINTTWMNAAYNIREKKVHATESLKSAEERSHKESGGMECKQLLDKSHQEQSLSTSTLILQTNNYQQDHRHMGVMPGPALSLSPSSSSPFHAQLGPRGLAEELGCASEQSSRDSDELKHAHNTVTTS